MPSEIPEVRSPTKSRKLSVRVQSETDGVAQEREQRRLDMFNQAAADVTEEDREERELLLGGFGHGWGRESK